MTQQHCHRAGCPNTPSLHIILNPNTSPTLRALATCDDHAESARNAGTLRAIHAFTTTCADPHASWLLTTVGNNECVLEPATTLRPTDVLRYEAIL